MVGITRAGRTRRAMSTVGVAGAMAVALALAGCGGGSSGGGSSVDTYGFPQVTQDDKAEITVWVDADRSSAADAFKKANPAVPPASRLVRP